MSPSAHPLYLDCAASAPMSSGARDALVSALDEHFANPSAVGHRHGATLNRLVETAREQVAALVGCEASGVIFTSGSTEASAIAIDGYLANRRSCHSVASVLEHAAVRERLGLHPHGELSLVGCSPDGEVASEDVLAAVRPDTTFVTVIHGHNELGSIQDLEGLARTLPSGVAFHSDATQSVVSEQLELERWGRLAISLSAHKIGGPKGVGALAATQEFLRGLECRGAGGGQESGYRSGTLNGPSIIAFGQACLELRQQREARKKRLRVLAERFLEVLRERLSIAQLLGPPLETNRLYHLLSLHIPGVPADLVQREVAADVSLAVGSACASDHRKPSPALVAAGLSTGAALEVVRVSFDASLTATDMEFAADSLARAVARLKV